MKTDKVITEVIFRVWEDDDAKYMQTLTYDTVFDVLALFPYEIVNRVGNCSSCQHVGQHSSADYDHCIKNSRPATEEEYGPLKAELEARGYNLRVIQRRSRKKYYKALERSI